MRSTVSPRERAVSATDICCAALGRACPSAAALLEAGRNAPTTRVPLRRVTSRADLLAALREAEAEEARRVGDLVDELRRTELRRETDEDGELTVDALGDQPFVGQAIRCGDRIVYASLVATKQAREVPCMN